MPRTGSARILCGASVPRQPAHRVYLRTTAKSIRYRSWRASGNQQDCYLPILSRLRHDRLCSRRSRRHPARREPLRHSRTGDAGAHLGARAGMDLILMPLVDSTRTATARHGGASMTEPAFLRHRTLWRKPHLIGSGARFPAREENRHLRLDVRCKLSPPISRLLFRITARQNASMHDLTLIIATELLFLSLRPWLLLKQAGIPFHEQYLPLRSEPGTHRFATSRRPARSRH